MLYLAYGSNLNIERMAVRCPAARPLRAYKLQGWRLVMRGVADLIPTPGAAAYVGLWEITDECLMALDRYEGYPRLYTRIRIPVVTRDRGRIEPMLYVMRFKSTPEPATSGYLETIVQGYTDFGIPDYEPLFAAQREALECQKKANATINASTPTSFTVAKRRQK